MPLVSIGSRNPLVDGRQSETALEIRRGMMRHFGKLGMAVLAEFPLASGRRADLIAMDRKGHFTIVEIKSSVEDFRIDTKWPEYKDHSDCFLFATHPNVPMEIFQGDEGLYIADSFGAHALREPVEQRLKAATRKALTLRFARLSALQLERLSQYGLANGLDMPTDFREIPDV